MIGARIGVDVFIAWRLRESLPLPPGLIPVTAGGGPWLLFACACLDRLRVGRLAMPGRRRHVAAWLTPCHLADGTIGNLFLSACSNDPLVVAAYRALGISRAAYASLHIDTVGLAAPKLRAGFGAPIAMPDLGWFKADRCGIIAGRGGLRRLPLAKRSWQYQIRSVCVASSSRVPHSGEPVAAIDCSHDTACWARPRASPAPP